MSVRPPPRCARFAHRVIIRARRFFYRSCSAQSPESARAILTGAAEIHDRTMPSGGPLNHCSLTRSIKIELAELPVNHTLARLLLVPTTSPKWHGRPARESRARCACHLSSQFLLYCVADGSPIGVFTGQFGHHGLHHST